MKQQLIMTLSSGTQLELPSEHLLLAIDRESVSLQDVITKITNKSCSPFSTLSLYQYHEETQSKKADNTRLLKKYHSFLRSTKRLLFQ